MRMSVDVQALMRMKKAVQEAKEQLIRAEAARDEALTRLKELGYDSVQKAQDALEGMSGDITDEEADLEDKIGKLFDDKNSLMKRKNVSKRRQNQKTVLIQPALVV
jgi:phage shock protein A